MVGTCPRCQKNLEISEKEFGTLFTCHFCLATFFVDWAGLPEKMETTSVKDEQGQGEQFEVFGEAEGSSDPELPVSPAPNEQLAPMTEAMESVSESATELEDSAVFAPDLGASPSAPEDFSDVLEYSNSPEPAGPLSYRFLVSELDSKEMISLFLEAIQDARLGLNLESVKAQMPSGQVTIENLSPAKLIVLVNRLKFSGLDIKWEQKLF